MGIREFHLYEIKVRGRNADGEEAEIGIRPRGELFGGKDSAAIEAALAIVPGPIKAIESEWARAELAGHFGEDGEIISAETANARPEYHYHEVNELPRVDLAVHLDEVKTREADAERAAEMKVG